VDELPTYYDLYAPMVYRRCLALLGDEDDALDAMQLVFVRLLETTPTIEDPPAFLYRAATNTCLNLIRSRRRYRARLDHVGLVEIANYEERGMLAARSSLARLFGLASESTRVMAVMHFVDGMTYEQVAAHVGMSASGVRRRLRVLRAQLHTLEGDTP
jgi:RNA polymerase sigma-70 factor (ECF subfamily)